MNSGQKADLRWHFMPQAKNAAWLSLGGMWSQFEDTPHFEIPIKGV
jgi:hypothetical protein